ncbi:MAG TPA: hypothetical protein PKC72_08350 [Chitinophagaceae bacterium]|nr:hypothetical protein [Chitinophagaceae bacterium]
MRLKYKKDLLPFKNEFEIWIDDEKYGTILHGQTIELDIKNNSKKIKIVNDGFVYASNEISHANDMTIKSYLRSPLTLVIIVLMIFVIFLKDFKGFEYRSFVMFGLLLYPAYFNTIGKKHYYTIK